MSKKKTKKTTQTHPGTSLLVPPSGNPEDAFGMAHVLYIMGMLMLYMVAVAVVLLVNRYGGQSAFDAMLMFLAAIGVGSMIRTTLQLVTFRRQIASKIGAFFAYLAGSEPTKKELNYRKLETLESDPMDAIDWENLPVRAIVDESDETEFDNEDLRSKIDNAEKEYKNAKRR